MPDLLPPHLPPSNLAFATGGGDMGALLRALDWAHHPLGPLATWSQPLRTAVSLMLGARQPMYVAWGPALHLLYNDAYRVVLGARGEHPEQTFGQPFAEVWADVWDEVRPMLSATLQGNPVHEEDHGFVVHRNGYPEQIYATFSTIALRDEAGQVAGVCCMCAETTAQVLAAQQRDHALHELETTNEKLRIAADAGEFGLFDHSLTHCDIVWNTHARTHFGVPPDGPVTHTLIDAAFHPDDRERVVARVAALLAAPGDGHYRDEYRTVSPIDGRERWIAASGRLLRDAAGAPERLVGTTLDITSRKLFEASVRATASEAMAAAEANAKFRTFFEQGTHFGILMTPSGTLIEANHVALDAGGYARGDVLGRPFQACGWWSGSPKVAAEIAACVALAAGGERVRCELPYFVAGGGERFIDLVIAPVMGDDGALLFVAATGSDITERRQVEERLRMLDAIGEATRVAHDPKTIMGEATRLLGQYLDVTRVAYADVEADNDRFTIRHDWVTPGAISTVGVYSLDLFGSRARADMREGRTLLIHDVGRELTDEDGAAMFTQIDVSAIICCPLVKGGRLAAMMAVHQRTPRVWTAGEVALVEAVVERCWAHIERVRASEALHEADRRKSEFLATLAHELRNPLAPIRNGLEIMRMGADKPGSALRLGGVRAMMERQVGHMVHLINDLLDIARVSSGKLVLQMQPVDLRDVIVTAIETSKPLIDAAGHGLTVDLPLLPVPVDVDPVRISQVVSNLLSNAAKYTPHGGRIVLTARIEGDEAVVTVRDNGVGIAADMLAAVFEMFTQVARSIERANGGLGIGLSLVRRLVELHGGAVSAQSAGVGLGSSFAVRLPLMTAALVASPEPAPAGAQHGGQGVALQVLVADDNVDAAATLAALLEIAGHTVRVVHDGAAAVEEAARFQPDLVFLDIGMPFMDGYEAARRLRQLPALDGVMLVALTGWGTEEDRARSRAAGFDRHLLKPALPDDVEAVLAAATSATSAAATARAPA